MDETKKYQICLIDGTNFMFIGDQANIAHKGRWSGNHNESAQMPFKATSPKPKSSETTSTCGSLRKRWRNENRS